MPMHLQAPVVGAVVDGYIGQPTNREGVCRSEERKRCADVMAEANRLADLAAIGNQLELIIEKQRSGPIGTIELWCDMAANVVRDPNQFNGEVELAA